MSTARRLAELVEHRADASRSTVALLLALVLVDGRALPAQSWHRAGCGRR